MNKARIFLSLTMFMSVPVQVQAIDLDCEVLADDVLKQLSAAGLLSGGQDGVEQANTIIMTSCRGAEESADEQLEASKQDWLNNWLFENTGGKPGNKRLKNLK